MFDEDSSSRGQIRLLHAFHKIGFAEPPEHILQFCDASVQRYQEDNELTLALFADVIRPFVTDVVNHTEVGGMQDGVDYRNLPREELDHIIEMKCVAAWEAFNAYQPGMLVQNGMVQNVENQNNMNASMSMNASMGINTGGMNTGMSTAPMSVDNATPINKMQNMQGGMQQNMQQNIQAPMQLQQQGGMGGMGIQQQGGMGGMGIQQQQGGMGIDFKSGTSPENPVKWLHDIGYSFIADQSLKWLQDNGGIDFSEVFVAQDLLQLYCSSMNLSKDQCQRIAMYVQSWNQVLIETKNNNFSTYHGAPFNAAGGGQGMNQVLMDTTNNHTTNQNLVIMETALTTTGEMAQPKLGMPPEFRGGINPAKHIDKAVSVYDNSPLKIIHANSNQLQENYFGDPERPYRIGMDVAKDKLGSGAFATVWKCWRVDPDHPERGEQEYAVKVVSLKKIKLQGHLFQAEYKKLQQEAKFLSELRNKYIVSMLDVCEMRDNLYIVMENVKYGELFDVIVKTRYTTTNNHGQVLDAYKGRLPEPEARYIFVQLAAGIKYIHGKSLVHRDLKPENILVSNIQPLVAKKDILGDQSNDKPGGGPRTSTRWKSLVDTMDIDTVAKLKAYCIKISDFGLSKMIASGYSVAVSKVGTEQYWSPEVVKASSRHTSEIDSSGNQQHNRHNRIPYTFSADYWSLGVILFVMCCGRYPFHGPTLKEYQLIGRYEYWEDNRLSESVKYLISCLIQVDPKKRSNMNDVLRSKWCTSALCDMKIHYWQKKRVIQQPYTGIDPTIPLSSHLSPSHLSSSPPVVVQVQGYMRRRMILLPLKYDRATAFRVSPIFKQLPLDMARKGNQMLQPANFSDFYKAYLEALHNPTTDVLSQMPTVQEMSMKTNLLGDLKNRIITLFQNTYGLDDLIDCELGRYSDRFYLDFKYLPYVFDGEKRTDLLGVYDANDTNRIRPDEKIPTMQMSDRTGVVECEILLIKNKNFRVLNNYQDNYDNYQGTCCNIKYHRGEDTITLALLDTLKRGFSEKSRLDQAKKIQNEQNSVIDILDKCKISVGFYDTVFQELVSLRIVNPEIPIETQTLQQSVDPRLTTGTSTTQQVSMLAKDPEKTKIISLGQVVYESTGEPEFFPQFGIELIALVNGGLIISRVVGDLVDPRVVSVPNSSKTSLYLCTGDVIQELDGKNLTTTAEFKAGANKGSLLLINRRL